MTLKLAFPLTLQYQIITVILYPNSIKITSRTKSNFSIVTTMIFDANLRV